MMTLMRLRNGIRTISLISSILTLASCAYRLPPTNPPSEELLRIVAKTPELYTVQADTGTVREYDVPHDGHFRIGIPSYRSSCGVYLFDAIKVGGYSDPLNAWSVSFSRSGKTVRKLSFRAIRKLPTDEAGYRLVRFGN